MPSMLVVRLADAVATPTPSLIHRAASAICEARGPARRVIPEPFSVGPLLPTPGGARTASWRLGWLDDNAPPPGWPPTEVRFGHRTHPVVGAEAHQRTYAELARVAPARAARLTLATPTFFCRDGRDLPLPDPALAIRCLVDRWNRHATSSLRIGPADASALTDTVYLDAVAGETEEVRLGHGLRQVGFVGEAELRLARAASDYTATMFAALAQFAPYAGLGEQTSFGFGAVDVDPVGLLASAAGSLAGGPPPPPGGGGAAGGRPPPAPPPPPRA
ncbi:MAG: CRISPR system precrRNA processing endoribonuclease RAMP protein Cas6, partial [Frankia sp.]|nr:CRISPR system precrRNA processing endoribonuclease RAMP protein Cas6 [Frankia sp.]